MTLKKVVVTIGLLLFMSGVRADVVTDYATGKCGRDLMTVLQSHCRPVNIHPQATSREVILQIFDTETISSLPDFLTDNATIGQATFQADNFIPTDWFNQGNPDRDIAPNDLYNIFPTTADKISARHGVPLLDNSKNACGIGNSTDGVYQVYQPGEQWKGTLARMALYVATVYSSSSAWAGNGAIIFNDFETYPLLSRRAVEQYMQWHNNYPPDEREIQWSQRIESLQGNINPFISHPELVSHIWGQENGTPYLPPTPPVDPENPDDPDDPVTPDIKVPLHAVYTSSETIYFYSPYIKGEATWAIDTQATDATSIKASDLGTGTHELRFNTATQSGKIIITIVP